MVAVLFGNPLTAPPSSDHHNKVLWVSAADSRRGQSERATLQRPANRRSPDWEQTHGATAGHRRARPLIHRPAAAGMLAADPALVRPPRHDGLVLRAATLDPTNFLADVGSLTASARTRGSISRAAEHPTLPR